MKRGLADAVFRAIVSRHAPLRRPARAPRLHPADGKLRLLTGYLAEAPDPDRGWGIAAITRDLALDSVKPAMLRALVTERVDPQLFALSYDFVGDLAETIALIWPSAAA